MNSSESTNQVFGIRVYFKTSPANLQAGKYVLKVKISDGGNPSCIKTDTFLVFIGDNSTRSQSDLIDKISSQITTSIYVNDALEPEAEASNEIDEDQDASIVSPTDLHLHNNNNNLTQHSRLSTTFSLNSLRTTEHFILITLVSTLFLIGSILSFIGLIFFCKSDSLSSRRGKAKTKKQQLEVKNYRGGGGSGSQKMMLNGGGEEEEAVHNDEMNNLLDVEATLNRLSLSLKSTDQSQSADSVMSNITFARDTTSSSSNSSQTEEHHQLHLQQQQQQQHQLTQPKYATAHKVTFGANYNKDNYHLRVRIYSCIINIYFLYFTKEYIINLLNVIFILRLL